MHNDASLDINQESNPVQTVAPPKEDNNMLRATDKITALYCRLSVEDTKEKGGKDDPSNSIQHHFSFFIWRGPAGHAFCIILPFSTHTTRKTEEDAYGGF